MAIAHGIQLSAIQITKLVFAAGQMIYYHLFYTTLFFQLLSFFFFLFSFFFFLFFKFGPLYQGDIFSDHFLCYIFQSSLHMLHILQFMCWQLFLYCISGHFSSKIWALLMLYFCLLWLESHIFLSDSHPSVSSVLGAIITIAP